MDDFVTFGKSIFGLSIKHPQDWTVTDYDRDIRDGKIGVDLFASICPKSVLEYPSEFLPDYSQCPRGKEVLVSIANLPLNATLEEFVDYAVSSGKFQYTGYKLTSQNITTVSGLPAKTFTYSYLGEYQGEEEIIKVLDLIAVNGTRAYEIAYSSPQLEFDDLMPTVQKMIDSIKIMPMPPCNFVKNETSGGKCVLSPSLST